MKIGVFGAGSIGCYLGGWLAAQGQHVVLLARSGTLEALGRGVALSQLDQRRALLSLGPQPGGGRLEAGSDPAALADCDTILVTVKSRDTEQAALRLAEVAPHALTISFQNGLHNGTTLARALPKAVAGMVSFNVRQTRPPGGPLTLHQGTSGPLVFGRAEGAEPVASALRAAGFATHLSARMPAVQWGKLVFNLNNATNALSGLPLREQLTDRGFRRLLADVMDEALGLLRAGDIRPARSGMMIPWLAPKVLRLPNRLFFLAARSMLAIDAQARSSMYEDLEARRPTEVAELNGEVVALAERLGHAAPLNQRLVQLIRDAEQAGQGSPRLSAEQIRGRTGAP